MTMTVRRTAVRVVLLFGLLALGACSSGGRASHPILTISGAERIGEDGIEVGYSPLQQDTIEEDVRFANFSVQEVMLTS